MLGPFERIWIPNAVKNNQKHVGLGREIFPFPAARVTGTNSRNRWRPTTKRPAGLQVSYGLPARTVLINGQRNCLTARTGDTAGIFHRVSALPTPVAGR